MILAVITIGTVMLMPGILNRNNHHRGPRLNCTNRLKQVGLAFKLWAIDHTDQFPSQISTNAGGTRELLNGVFAHFRVISNELSTPKVLLCPADLKRSSATSFAALQNPNISYFVGVDAVATNE